MKGGRPRHIMEMKMLLLKLAWQGRNVVFCEKRRTSDTVPGASAVEINPSHLSVKGTFS